MLFCAVTCFIPEVAAFLHGWSNPYSEYRFKLTPVPAEPVSFSRADLKQTKGDSCSILQEYNSHACMPPRDAQELTRNQDGICPTTHVC